ncbi:MAG: nuclear transport factor 2 family protein, partial [Nannocystaceae bacterium]|nr:nuclear transport factor 2 family protein [Nannocystaceae bacterium]
IALACGASVSSPTLPEVETTMSTTSPEQAVLHAVETMTAAFHAKDIDGVMASYADGATIVFEPGVSIQDPAAQREAFQGFFSMTPQFTYSGHEVVVSGIRAVHLAPWTMRGTQPDGQAVEMKGLSVAVLERQPDGRWLMVIDNPFGDQLLNRG